MIKKTHKKGSPIFEKFKKLDREQPFDIVSFFKHYEVSFQELDFNEQNHLLSAYGDALFKLGRHRPYLKVADCLIELSILQNIRFVQGEDIYRKSLYQKGLAYFYLHDYRAASHIARELIKLSPEHRSYRNLLRRCMVRERPAYVKQLIGAGASIYLFCVLLVLIEFIFVARFHAEYQPYIEYFRIVAFGVGLLALIGGESIHHWNIRQKISKYTEEAKLRKNEKKKY